MRGGVEGGEEEMEGGGRRGELHVHVCRKGEGEQSGGEVEGRQRKRQREVNFFTSFNEKFNKTLNYI